MLEHECEIDVALNDPTDDEIEQAVDLANQIIWESRPVKVSQVSSEAAAALPLRKEPGRAGELRLIEISDFDLTPCGGTHARSTGEVGVIAVRSWERAKGLTRIHFMAGVRALADYRKVNQTAREVAALFSSGREDSPALVSKMIDDHKKLMRRLSELEQIASHVEAAELLKHATPRAGADDRSEGRLATAGDTTGDPVEGNRVPVFSKSHVVAKVFDDRNADSLKHLALALIAHPNTVALLGSRDAETARLIFARSLDLPVDMNALMRKACDVIDGRGGGKPDMAQGGGKNIDRLDEAIRNAEEDLMNT
jgi:alanyl-tRNA synthetase